MVSIIVAIIGGIVTIIVALISAGRLHKVRHKLDQATNEMNLQSRALDLAWYIGSWNFPTQFIRDMFESDENEVERFMVLNAWNGELDPKWTTSIFQWRRDSSEVLNYIHQSLDDDYADKLREIQSKGNVLYNVEEMEEGTVIKDIYRHEGVTSSLWSFIQSDVKGTGKAVMYCSFATKNPEGLSENSIAQCKLLVNYLQGMSADLDDKLRQEGG